MNQRIAILSCVLLVAAIAFADSDQITNIPGIGDGSLQNFAACSSGYGQRRQSAIFLPIAKCTHHPLVGFKVGCIIYPGFHMIII